MSVPMNPRAELKLRQHYLIERELADRLRRAGRHERPQLYRSVYDELFRRVPAHPQLLAACDPRYAERRQRSVERELRFLRPYLDAGRAFMEIGAGDCALSLRATALARHVYAIDVSEQITGGAAGRPWNFELRLTEGTCIPVGDGAVDVAYSNQLMEHLHPEDALEQLREIHRSLAPGGIYACITPNRLYGPRDISASFDEVATCLHLREYTARELRELMLEAGFSQVRFHAGSRGRYVECPYASLAALESALEVLPYPVRKRIADNAPMRALLGLRVTAVKAA
jgi:SAM-dependent methyltransferase